VEEFGAVIGFVLSIGFLLAMISVWQGKRADRTLAASREKFQAIFNQTFQFIVILSPSGIIQEINKTAFEFYGGIEEDLVGKRLFETTWWSTIPEMRKRLSEAVNKATSGQMDRFEYKRSDSHEDMRVMDVSVKPVHDYESGEIEYLVVEGRDITDKWNAEQELRWLNEELEMRVQARTMALEKSLSSLKETQDQLVESEKMASLGGLVAGVAHEINTPLGIGVTTTSYLDQKIDEMLEKYENETITRADFEKFLHVSKESATSSLLNLTRASELIHSFKQVAADQSSESRREFELKSYLDEILLSLHSMYKKSGHEVTIYGEEIELKSYPGAIMQIMTNLLNNALQHGFEKKKNGKIMITTSRRDGMAVIKFADDGAGMNEYVLKRIYEPFFTTKRSQGGAGLGMHVVYNLVNRTLGGTIQCSSTQGQGTVFNISIPVDAPRNDT
jgi:PAS domain S-box-containing protein